MFRILFNIIWFVSWALLIAYVKWTPFRFGCWAVASITWFEIGVQLQKLRKEVANKDMDER